MHVNLNLTYLANFLSVRFKNIFILVFCPEQALSHCGQLKIMSVRSFMTICNSWKRRKWKLLCPFKNCPLLLLIRDEFTILGNKCGIKLPTKKIEKKVTHLSSMGSRITHPKDITKVKHLHRNFHNMLVFTFPTSSHQLTKERDQPSNRP